VENLKNARYEDPSLAGTSITFVAPFNRSQPLGFHIRSLAPTLLCHRHRADNRGFSLQGRESCDCEFRKMRNSLYPVSILVAERHPSARESLADLLRLDGYSVFEAATAQSGMEHLANHSRLKAILLDLSMPGWKAVAEHALKLAPGIRVFGMAVKDELPDARDLNESGVSGCFLKPLVYADVRERLPSPMALAK
jgi:CheY-like chemotaxis protein